MSFVGVLMLQTRFPRPPGDIGNPASLAIPLRYHVIEAATPARVVQGRGTGLLPEFIAASREFVAEGAVAISTSCGFLILFQRELQDALAVPVWSSSLLKLPELRRPGLITVDAAALGPEHLQAAGADPATPVQGLAPGCSLQRTLLEDRPHLDAAQAEADTVAAAQALLARHPELSDIVFECTNLPPYAAAVRRATGRPVHHILSLIEERWHRREQKS